MPKNIPKVPDWAIDALLGRGLAHKEWKIVLEGGTFSGQHGGLNFQEWREVFRGEKFQWVAGLQKRIFNREYEKFRPLIEALLAADQEVGSGHSSTSVNSIRRRVMGKDWREGVPNEMDERLRNCTLFGADAKPRKFHSIVKAWRTEAALLQELQNQGNRVSTESDHHLSNKEQSTLGLGTFANEATSSQVFLNQSDFVDPASSYGGLGMEGLEEVASFNEANRHPGNDGISIDPGLLGVDAFMGHHNFTHDSPNTFESEASNSSQPIGSLPYAETSAFFFPWMDIEPGSARKQTSGAYSPAGQDWHSLTASHHEQSSLDDQDPCSLNMISSEVSGGNTSYNQGYDLLLISDSDTQMSDGEHLNESVDGAVSQSHGLNLVGKPIRSKRSKGTAQRRHLLERLNSLREDKKKLTRKIHEQTQSRGICEVKLQQSVADGEQLRKSVLHLEEQNRRALSANVAKDAELKQVKAELQAAIAKIQTLEAQARLLDASVKRSSRAFNGLTQELFATSSSIQEGSVGVEEGTSLLKNFVMEESEEAKHQRRHDEIVRQAQQQKALLRTAVSETSCNSAEDDKENNMTIRRRRIAGRVILPLRTATSSANNSTEAETNLEPTKIRREAPHFRDAHSGSEDGRFRRLMRKVSDKSLHKSHMQKDDEPRVPDLRMWGQIHEELQEEITHRLSKRLTGDSGYGSILSGLGDELDS